MGPWSWHPKPRLEPPTHLTKGEASLPGSHRGCACPGLQLGDCASPVCSRLSCQQEEVGGRHGDPALALNSSVPLAMFLFSLSFGCLSLVYPGRDLDKDSSANSLFGRRSEETLGGKWGSEARKRRKGMKGKWSG